MAVKNIYGVLSPPPEDHHEAIDKLNTIIQGMQTKHYELEVLTQANAVLTISRSAVMAHLAHMTVAMNSIQEQLKKL